MPITHIGTAVGTVQNSASITVTTPAGLQAGDLILCVTSERYPGGITGYSSISGFKRLTPLQRLTNSYSTVHFKVANGSETSITAAPSGETMDTGVMSVSVFRGIDVLDPIDVMTTRVGANSGSAVLPATTPNRNECYVVGIVTKAASSFSSVSSDWSGSGYTELGEGGWSDGVGHLVALGGRLQATSADIGTEQVATGMSGNWGTFAVSLRPSYRTYVLDDAPTSYWKLDETNKNGTTCVAEVGSNLTYTSNVESVSGRQGAAAKFLGPGSYASVNASPETAYDTVKSITLECWAAFSDTSKLSALISKRISSISANQHFALFHHGSLNGNMVVDIGCNTTTGNRWHTGYVPPADKVFRHYVVTYNSANNRLTLYVNGKNVSESTSLQVQAQANDAPFSIGSLWGSAYDTNVNVDEVAIYNGTCLTATQVKDHYRAGIPAGVKSWNGSSWIEAPVKVRNAQGGYVEAPAKVWNGYDWV